MGAGECPMIVSDCDNDDRVNGHFGGIQMGACYGECAAVRTSD